MGPADWPSSETSMWGPVWPLPLPTLEATQVELESHVRTWPWSRPLSPLEWHVCPMCRGQPSAEGAARRLCGGLRGRLAAPRQLSLGASLGPGLELQVMEKNPVLVRAALPGGHHRALHASELGRVRAVAESSTGTNGQTLVSSSEASDKFHLSVYEEK